jgi:hypothetical protein
MAKTTALLLLFAVSSAATGDDDLYDVLVYGSTPGAVMAAVAAARQGARTVLVDPAPRVGGVCSGGLGHTDKGNPIVIGGYAREFFTRNARAYDAGAVAPDFSLEPHVAEAVRCGSPLRAFECCYPHPTPTPPSNAPEAEN